MSQLFQLWSRGRSPEYRAAPPAPITPSEAARILSEEARSQKAKRTAMLCELRREVRECEIKPHRWQA